MAKSSQPVIKVTELNQVCMVVKDVEKSAKAMWDTFGIGPWNIFVCDPIFNDEMTYYGKPGHFSFKVALTQKKLGGVEIEVVEPLEGDSIYRDILRDNGESIHHLGHHEVDSMKSFDETVSALEKAGFPCMMSAKAGAGKAGYAYMDTYKVLNTILEVTWGDPSWEVPFEMHTFPE